MKDKQHVKLPEQVTESIEARAPWGVVSRNTNKQTELYTNRNVIDRVQTEEEIYSDLGF